jgi:uncharacterized membrane protein YphA (DoxX/SURF4 family)
MFSITDVVSSVCALIITGVFWWAGIAKLRSRVNTQSAFKNLGLPIPNLLSTIVPLAEIGIGAVMILQQRFGAVLAIVLLGVFTAFLVGKLRTGSAVSCGCFGSAQTTPVSWITIGRNAALIALGVFAMAVKPSIAPLSRTASLHIALMTTAATTALVGALIISLLTIRRMIGHPET